MTMEEQIQELILQPQSYWNVYAFSREPLSKRIPPEEQSRLADLAVCCGRDEARKIAAKFPGRAPGEICRELGIHVTYDTAENGGHPLIVAAFREPDDIRLSLDALRRVEKWLEGRKSQQKQSQQNQLQQKQSQQKQSQNERYAQNWHGKKREQDIRDVLFSKWKPEEILLAHELFHYVELKEGNLSVATERVRLKFGPFTYHGRVQILSEIAGMAFAQELLQLTYCPFALDRVFLYVYGRNESYGN